MRDAGRAARRAIASQAKLGVVVAGAVALWATAAGSAGAIDVNLSMEEAKKALAAGREPLRAAYKSAESEKEVKKVLQQAALATRVGADPEKTPCGANAILRTKRYWLEAFGRKEAMESQRQKREVRMPDDKIQKYLEMPNLEVEIQTCGDDEYFADGAQVALQQGSKTIRPVDVSQAERGRKNEGQGPAYRARFTARFAYDSFDPNAKTKMVVFFPDGRQEEFEADFSKVK